MSSLALLNTIKYKGISAVPLFNLKYSTTNLLFSKYYSTKPVVHQLSFVIDGPSASGKSAIARVVSKKLGLNWVDSQAINRAIILKCQKKNIPLSTSNGKAISELVKNSEFKFTYDAESDTYKVMIDGKDVTKEVEDANISEEALLTFLSIPEVTEELKDKQRKLVYITDKELEKELENEKTLNKDTQSNNKRSTSVDEEKFYCTIFEGRTAGKDILPDAHLLFNLKTNIKVRAQRRFKELKEKGKPKSINAILKEMKANDANFAKLTKPLDSALNINTTELLPHEQEETITYLIKDRIKRYIENTSPY